MRTYTLSRCDKTCPSIELRGFLILDCFGVVACVIASNITVLCEDVLPAKCWTGTHYAAWRRSPRNAPSSWGLLRRHIWSMLTIYILLSYRPSLSHIRQWIICMHTDVRISWCDKMRVLFDRSGRIYEVLDDFWIVGALVKCHKKFVSCSEKSRKNNLICSLR